MSTTIVRVPVAQSFWDTYRAALHAASFAELNHARTEAMFKALPATDPAILNGREQELQGLLLAYLDARHVCTLACEALAKAETDVRLGGTS